MCVKVSGGCRVYAYLHTYFVATCNSVINLILVVTFRSAALVKVDAFVKALTLSTSNALKFLITTSAVFL